MHIIRIFLLITLFFNTSDEIHKERSLFVPPLKIPIALSANFGELRSDHFHSGLDMKTQGVTGKEVVASARGFVYRISVSPGGFGKTIYMRHPSGYSTVYAHLDRFIPDIEEYVIAKQYEKKSFVVNLFPPKEMFRFDQGDLIAFSGNSGSSTGPHLHYEIRKSDGETPVNPLLFDFGIEDTFRPVIEKLVIYPVNENTLINNQNKPLHISTTGGHGSFHLPYGKPVTISGAAGFGIKAYDLFNNSLNRCAVYSITLSIDSITLFSYKIDGFSYNETRYINSHIDYETLLKEKIYIERLYLQPNNKFSAYQNVVGKGVFDFNDDKKHLIDIIVTDIHGNKSSLSFSVSSVKRSGTGPGYRNDNLVIMPYARNNRFANDRVAVNITSGTLYDTLRFEYRKSAGRNGMYSEIHHIHNRYTPVHKPYSLSIRPDSILAGREGSMFIVQTGLNGQDMPLRSSFGNGFLSANPVTFGSFYIGIDTIPPVISPNGFVPGSDLTGRKELRLRITDNFSGIRSYEPSVDGRWALFEYDQKNNMLIYRFDQKRINKGTKHILVLRVSDNADNVSTFSSSFTW